MKEIIKVNNLNKIFNLYPSHKDRLKEIIHPFRKKFHREFYALNNINFTIHEGETVGIIGKNGSGKSTLLKIITGILTKTSGDMSVIGRISSLLELGAGFNPELSGLENIYFHGNVLGFSNKEIDEIKDEIIEFSGIGHFIDQPVKLYSSGMFVRLAFSVSIFVKPDILIIDEALSVGDVSFQMKCYNRFNTLREEGKTILFVTHSLESIIRYCNRCLVLNEGKLVLDGSAKEGVDTYKQIMVNQFNKATNVVKSKISSDLFVGDSLLRYGDNRASIIDFYLLDDQNNKVLQISNSSKVTFKLKILFKEFVANPVIAFTIKDVTGLELTGTNTYLEKTNLPSCEKGESISISFSQKLLLRDGNYTLSLGVVTIENGEVTVHERIYDALIFDVINSHGFVGIINPESTITFSKEILQN